MWPAPVRARRQLTQQWSKLLQTRSKPLSWLVPSNKCHARTYAQSLPQPVDSGDFSVKDIFDLPNAWQTFVQKNISVSSHGLDNSVSTGLLGSAYLTSPSGFLPLAQAVRRSCDGIVQIILRAQSLEELKKLPRQLDLLSDQLCRVLDLAEFVRMNHPNVKFQQAAEGAYAFLWEYMNILNTTPGLKIRLDKALNMPEVANCWTAEEVSVAKVLLKDFSNSAIDLPSHERQRFVELSNDVKSLGSNFVNNMCPATESVELRSNQLAGLSPAFIARFSNTRSRSMHLPLSGDIPFVALSSLKDENARKTVYMASKRVGKRQLEILSKLLNTRFALAQLSDFQSHAEMNLSDKMARTPDAVHSFLQALARNNEPRLRTELDAMAKLKNRDTGQPSHIQVWDIAYYQQQLISEASRSKASLRSTDSLSDYLSLGSVIQGLSDLFTRLYGVRFVPRAPLPDEVWDPGVRRLDILDEQDTPVAVLYCDLFARRGKNPNPAHFTLRCSRDITAEEVAQHYTDLGNLPTSRKFTSAHCTTTGILSSPTSPNLTQLPVIALICDFHPPSAAPNSPPTLLSLRDLQTLFHEMGHAIHSILARTSHHVVSGTRCPTDFAELPSVLMEQFATSPTVLSLFASHWRTKAPLPPRLLPETMRADNTNAAISLQTQINYSLLDWTYHHRWTPGACTTQLFRSVYASQPGRLQEPDEITPQGLFGHLVEYGGTYYSYLFDRALAGKIWRDVFGSGARALDRAAGNALMQCVLRHGGARDAWLCVGDLFARTAEEAAVSAGIVATESEMDGPATKASHSSTTNMQAVGPLTTEPQLHRPDNAMTTVEDAETIRQGGTKAMELVGRWGVDIS